ncbi:MAG: metallophosphoesterase [Nitrososphaerota archaeon]|nr:metallophosphoesterase [Nitrososphaerota archaeon]MDG7036106.1 metallophosphoesterase [Nitrososphaerota archaeon]MDG7037829.1 metallophosphoesterase [Nitrososphaerota archaeon]
MIRLVNDIPALEIDKKYLVVGDLHVGYEFEAMKRGIHIPPLTRTYKNYIRLLSSSSNASELYILGDLKNAITFPGSEETAELLELLEEINASFKVNLVKGNHDGSIERILPSYVTVFSPSGTVLKSQGRSYGILHGHARPSKAVATSDCIIMAHLHLFIRYGSSKYPVWLIQDTGKLPSFILIPPFNQFIPGMGLRNPRMKIPFFERRLIDFNVYMLDGKLLGGIRNLKGTLELEND